MAQAMQEPTRFNMPLPTLNLENRDGVSVPRMAPKKKGSKKMLLLLVLILLIAISGGVAALYLVRQSQDVRQQASTDEEAKSICEELRPAITQARVEWKPDTNVFEFNWGVSGGKPGGFRIWNVAYTSPSSANDSEFYLKNLTETELGPSATSFVFSDGSSLQTKRFVIRAIADLPTDPIECYSETFVCAKPVITEVVASKEGANKVLVKWVASVAPDLKYQLFLVDSSDLGAVSSQANFLATLNDSIPKDQDFVEVEIPEQYVRNPVWHLLLVAVHAEGESASQCSASSIVSVETGVVDPATTATPTPTGLTGTRPTNTPTPTTTTARATLTPTPTFSASGQCTVRFSIAALTVTPTATPTITPTQNPSETPRPTATATPNPTATPTTIPTPVVGCNDACMTNANCSNSNHICYFVSENEGRCRLDSNPSNTECRPAVAVVPPTTTPVVAQPELPEVLPESGPADWGNWLKAGLAVLGVGIALLLLL